MTIGDKTDMNSRLQKLVPNGWFTVGQSPVRDAILAAAASVLAFGFSLLAYVRQQTRIATASDGFLDMIAGDFFGTSLLRSGNQSDTSYRSRIIANMFRERGTRKAVAQVLTQLTGRAPIIFEPLRPLDTGSYGGPMCGYGVAGGYGSMLLPMQAFVTAFRASTSEIPNIAGYGITTAGYSVASQGEYVTQSMVQPSITDADIYAAINSVRPASYVIWSRIAN